MALPEAFPDNRKTVETFLFTNLKRVGLKIPEIRLRLGLDGAIIAIFPAADSLLI
ncbi:MAG: hypothetical protein HKUEN02_09220 [Anaerolineaceae bacterium]|nr:MAG: hypothetical protein HKUEN02_09220 [Anaerolineaceae bacterium]